MLESSHARQMDPDSWHGVAFCTEGLLLWLTWWLHLLCMHACSKKGRTLEKCFKLKSKVHRDKNKRDEIGMQYKSLHIMDYWLLCAMPISQWCNPYIVALLKTTTWACVIRGIVLHIHKFTLRCDSHTIPILSFIPFLYFLFLNFLCLS